MTSDDIIWVTDDGEARCARCRNAQPMPGATLCEGCAATRNPCPPGCVADCKECVVEDCWVEVAA